MATIFIVEDDATLRRELCVLLSQAGHTPVVATTFSDAAAEAIALDGDLVILDLKLPGAHGLDICREIRASSDVPIIILTSSDSERDEVLGMNLGADDYVTKPYRPAALLARIDAILRRGGLAQAPAALVVDGVKLDQIRCEVSFDGRTTLVTRNEARILALLMDNAGQTISRQELMVELWHSDVFIENNTLAVNITRLRRKLDKIGIPADFLETRRGAGYVVGAKD